MLRSKAVPRASPAIQSIRRRSFEIAVQLSTYWHAPGSPPESQTRRPGDGDRCETGSEDDCVQTCALE
jgi:hypothetical protein